jgi:hypothetical protein
LRDEEKTFGGAFYTVVQTLEEPVVICRGKRLPLDKLKKIADTKPPNYKIGDVEFSLRGNILLIGCLEEPFSSFKKKVNKEYKFYY